MTHINPFSIACDYESLEMRRCPLGILGGRMFYETSVCGDVSGLRDVSSSPAVMQYTSCGGVVYPEVCLIDASHQCRISFGEEEGGAATHEGDMFAPFGDRSSANAVHFIKTNDTRSVSFSPSGQQRIFDLRGSASSNLPTHGGMKGYFSWLVSPTSWLGALMGTQVATQIKDGLSPSSLAAVPFVRPALGALSVVLPQMSPWTLPVTEATSSLFRLDPTPAQRRAISVPSSPIDSASPPRLPLVRVKGDLADIPTVQLIAFHPYLPVLAICLQRGPRGMAAIKLFSVTEGAFIEGVELVHGYQRGVTTMEWKRPYSKGVLAVGCSGGALLWSIRCLEEFGSSANCGDGTLGRSLNATTTDTAAGNDSVKSGGASSSGVRSAWRRGKSTGGASHVAETDASAPSIYAFNKSRGVGNAASWAHAASPPADQLDGSSPSGASFSSTAPSATASVNTTFLGRPSKRPVGSSSPGAQPSPTTHFNSSPATCVCYPCAGGDQSVLISSIVFAKLPVLANDGSYISRDVMLCGSRQSPFTFIFDLHALPEESLMAKVPGYSGGVSCLGVSCLASSGAAASLLASRQGLPSGVRAEKGAATNPHENGAGASEEESANGNKPFDRSALAVASRVVNRIFCVRGFERSKQLQVLNLGLGWGPGSTTTFDVPQPIHRVERCDVVANDAFAMQFDSCEVVCLAIISPKQVTILANIITGIHRGVGGRVLDIRVCDATLYARVTSGHVLCIALLGSLRSSRSEGRQLNAIVTGGVPLGSFSAASKWSLSNAADRGYLLCNVVGNNCVVSMDVFQNFQNGSLLAVVDSVSGVLKVVPTYANRRY